MIPRTYLFVPGDNARMLSKAVLRGADALIVDLEDSVAPSNKETARAVVVDWLDRCERKGYPTWIRMNPGTRGTADLELLKGRQVNGVVIPKVGTAAEVSRWSTHIAEISEQCSLIVLIETASAVRHVDEIASCPGVSQLMLGEADLGAEIGMSQGHTPWDAVRADIVVASAAAAISPPIAPVDPNFSNPERIESETHHLRQLGFGSRAVIHPDQIDPVHRAMTPSPEEVEEAERVVKHHEIAMASGEGAYLDDDGAMIDEALVRHARNLLSRSRDIRR